MGDSTPERRRRRYGDVQYDWDNRVNTTSATVDWRNRLLGVFHSPYQPTDPSLFHEMLGALKIDFRGFTFIDLGSGKGRVLLIAADYPFRRIVGVELLTELHGVALENLRQYKSNSQKCFDVETICGDARTFTSCGANRALSVQSFDGRGTVSGNRQSRALFAGPTASLVLALSQSTARARVGEPWIQKA